MFSQIFKTDLKMNITPEETLIFENAKTCYFVVIKNLKKQKSTKRQILWSMKHY
jgi:hypothetical protein